MNIPQRVHGVIDYVLGGILLTSPWMVRFEDEATSLISFAFGSVIVLYSLMTDYDLAILRFVPFPIHRGLDFLWGFLLALSPVHFAVNGTAAVIFVLVGVASVAMSLLTRGRFSETGQDKPLIPGLK